MLCTYVPDVPMYLVDDLQVITVSDFTITHKGGIAEYRLMRPDSRNCSPLICIRQSKICANTPVKRGDCSDRRGDKAFASGTDISNFKDFQSAQDAINYEAMIGRHRRRSEVISPSYRVASRHCCRRWCSNRSGGRCPTGDTDTRFYAHRSDPWQLFVGRKSQPLVHLLGESRTRYLMLTAEFLEVESLTTSGFVSEVLESAALCDQRARDLAVHMTTLAPLTISATRDGLARLEERPVPADSDLIRRCYLSDDFSEGVDAFFAKRKPTWSGQ